MKSSLLITLLSAVSNVFAADPPKTFDQLAPVIKVASVKEVTPLIRSDAKRQLIRFGPWEVPAAKVSCVKLRRAKCQ
jgi:hypothetical protein